jgi:hypothetical protein
MVNYLTRGEKVKLFLENRGDKINHRCKNGTILKHSILNLKSSTEYSGDLIP